MGGLEASLLLGSAHSMVLAAVLARRAQNRRANRYLAALLGVLVVLLFDGFLRARGTLQAHPHLIGLSAWVPFVLGPLVFLYVREMTAPDPARLRPAWRHLIVPAIYFLLLAVTFYPRSADYKLGVAEHNRSMLVQATEVGLLFYGLAYAGAALVLLRRHQRTIESLFSNLRGVSLRWLFALAVLNAIVWCAALVAFVIRVTGVTDATAAAAIVPIGSTVTVFVIGYFQLGQVEIFAAVPAVPAVVEAPSEDRSGDTRTVPTTGPSDEASSEGRSGDTQPDTQPAPEARARPAPAYQRARLGTDDAVALEARIRAAMTDKRLYQRAGLTLAELADEVAATPHEVSQVLSTRLQRNFYNFVNEHRIEHVKSGLQRTDRPVLDLAFEAGFQSKSTFNTAFRKATGTTPREFRQRATA